MAKKDVEPEVASESLQPMVALLRGINLAGNNRLSMKDLIQIFSDASCANVSSYIQSGNILFRASSSVAGGLPDCISREIEQRFGFRIPVVLRSLAELHNTVQYNPFVSSEVDEANLHVYFLAHRPTAQQAASLEANRSPPDEFVLRDGDIYVHLRNTMARTKLTNTYFDKKLSTVATARNWRTTRKLLELMQAL